MSDILVRIKRAILSERYLFSEKARLEMEADGLSELDVAESIVNSVSIDKEIRTRSPFCNQAKEYLYINRAPT